MVKLSKNKTGIDISLYEGDDHALLLKMTSFIIENGEFVKQPINPKLYSNIIHEVKRKHDGVSVFRLTKVNGDIDFVEIDEDIYLLINYPESVKEISSGNYHHDVRFFLADKSTVRTYIKRSNFYIDPSVSEVL